MIYYYFDVKVKGFWTPKTTPYDNEDRILIIVSYVVILYVVLYRQITLSREWKGNVSLLFPLSKKSETNRIADKLINSFVEGGGRHGGWGRERYHQRHWEIQIQGSAVSGRCIISGREVRRTKDQFELKQKVKQKLVNYSNSVGH